MTRRPGFDEARRRAGELGGARVPRAVPVALERAVDRILAVEVRASTHVPPHDVAAAHGWAVRGDGPWQVVEGGRLQPRQAAVVRSGSAVPRGTEAVVRREHARIDAGTVRAARPAPGSEVRTRGADLLAGAVVLARGSLLTPVRLGLAASAGVDAVHVVVPPRTVVLVCGDDLVGSGVPVDGKVRDVLGHLLPSLLHGLGADVERSARTGDDVETLHDVFAGPYRGTVDLVVTTGGTGDGSAGTVRTALAAAGARLVVDAPAVDPGGTALVATVPDGPVVVALPGHPVAAVAALVTLAEPLLTAWLGRTATHPEPVLAPRVAGHAAPPDGALTRLAPARLVAGRAEVGRVAEVGGLGALVDATGVVVLDPDGGARWLPLPR